MLFSCLQSALEEAQFLANELRGCGQRRSAYIVQKLDVWAVTGRKPKCYIAMTVEPSVKDGAATGVSYNATRDKPGKWRAVHYHPATKYAKSRVEFLGWHRHECQAIAAVKQYRESLDAT